MTAASMKKVFLGLVGGLVLYEAITVANDSDDDTISEIVWDAAQRPLVPFVAGVLMGHFFWQRTQKQDKGKP